jgi:hypothetical protein
MIYNLGEDKGYITKMHCLVAILILLVYQLKRNVSHQ